MLRLLFPLSSPEWCRCSHGFEGISVPEKNKSTRSIDKSGHITSSRVSSTTSAAASACPCNLASRSIPATATFTEPRSLRTVRRWEACALQDRSGYVRSSQLKGLQQSYRFIVVCTTVVYSSHARRSIPSIGTGYQCLRAYRQRPTRSPSPLAPPLLHATGVSRRSGELRHPLLLWMLYLAGVTGERGAILQHTQGSGGSSDSHHSSCLFDERVEDLCIFGYQAVQQQQQQQQQQQRHHHH